MEALTGGWPPNSQLYSLSPGDHTGISPQDQFLNTLQEVLNGIDIRVGQPKALNTGPDDSQSGPLGPPHQERGRASSPMTCHQGEFT